MKRKFFILTILSLLMVFNVNAKEDKKNCDAIAYRIKFEELDENGKGYITEKIYAKYTDGQWRLLDKVEEEVISKDDFVGNCKKETRCNPEYKAKIFEEWDLNKDGKVTKREYKLKRKLEFAQMDKNGNGKVTENQYNDAMNKMSYKFKFEEKTPNIKIKENYKYKVK